MNKQAYVYILASQRNGTIYTGVTSNLVKRIHEHKTKIHADSFTAKYSVDKLVWYVAGESIIGAIALEKKIKNRNRSWKIALIEKDNPEWNDLSVGFMDSATNAQNDDVNMDFATNAQNDDVNMDSATNAQNDVGATSNE